MIPIPSGVRVWIATGHTDMRRGMQSLALAVQESLKRDPHAGDLYIFRGRRGDLVKILWHDGLGMSLYAKRLGVRSEHSRPLMVALEAWLREQRAKLSGQSNVSKAIAYCLTRWVALTRFLDDGRLCMSNNAAEREIRPIAVGRHNWTFAGSDEGGRRAAAIYTLIHTARINDVDPHAWLADVLARLQEHPAKRIDELLPWNWKRERLQKAAA